MLSKDIACLISILSFLIISSPSQAGYFDQLVNDAKKTIEDGIQNTINGTSDNNQEDGAAESEQHKDQSNLVASKGTSSDVVDAGTPYKPKDVKEVSRATYRATLHYHPEVLEDETWLKNASYKLFPKESTKFTQNEFAWHKGKAEMKEKILSEIDNPPLTISATIDNQSGGYIVVGNYDFDKQAFKILSAKIPLSGIGDSRPYVQKLYNAIMSQGWLSVPQDMAEQVAKTPGNRRLYGEYNFTVIDAKKYNQKGETRLLTEYKIEKIKLYDYQNQKYNYVVTINIPDITDNKPDSVAVTQPQKTKSPDKTTSSPQPEKKAPAEALKEEKKPAAEMVTKPSDPYIRANSGHNYGSDVVNMKLGMTLEQAQEQISKRKAIMKVVNGTPPRPFSSAKLFILKPGDEYISLMTLKTPNGPRIASIERTVYFDPDDSPSQTAVLSSIEKKYGKSTSKYDSVGIFDRSWYSDSNSKLYTTDGPEVRPCEYTFSGSAYDVWLENGKAYQWTLPWRQKQYMAVRNGKEVSTKTAEDQSAYKCGPANKIHYSKNDGMLTGPSLDIHVYDPAWIIAELRKTQKKEASQGATGLDL